MQNYKMNVTKAVRSLIRRTGMLEADKKDIRYENIYTKYQRFTMNPKRYYLKNLELAEMYSAIEGDVVECGVWRGGMIAGMAEILGKNRNYYLYDSFEGLPPASEIDGQTAIDWQRNTESDAYHENCKADISFAKEAMDLAGVKYNCVKGWFKDTVPSHSKDKIAILRLDGDWYESTLVCLQHLYPLVAKEGIVILDDYYFWDGCSKATHDYLSSIKSSSRIYRDKTDVAYIVKKDD